MHDSSESRPEMAHSVSTATERAQPSAPTPREIVLAKREAFVSGAIASTIASIGWFVAADRTRFEREAIRSYPLPRTTVLREETFGSVPYRVRDGVLEYRQNTSTRWHQSMGIVVKTIDDARRVLDLFEHPTREIEDDGRTTGSET